MRKSFLFLMLAVSFNTAWADFSDTSMSYHPRFIEAGDPYILDFRGDWPTDCHPGEQKPVISSYTGDSVLIEFETITEHVTCNDVETPFRVLVDMSDVVGDEAGEFNFVEVTIRYGGAERVYSFDKQCVLCGDPVPPPRDVKPETGVYSSQDLELQGLLIARQKQRMGVYPLIYDQNGSSEWLLGPGGIVEDTFFSGLYEFTGGQCLGCMPPDDPPQFNAVGKISMLMDSEGVVQVKVDDGLFNTYVMDDFGYGDRDIGGVPAHRAPDLSGRWALVEDLSNSPLLNSTESNTSFLPLVFDITLESVSQAPYSEDPIPYIGDTPPHSGDLPPTPPGYAMFAIRDKGGNELARLRCDYGSDWENTDAELICEMYNSEINDGTTFYRVNMLSLERLHMVYSGPVISRDSYVDLVAVRVD